MLKGFFRTDARPTKWEKVILPLIPFTMLVAIFMSAYVVRHRDNPEDKLVPSPVAIAKAFYKSATEPRIGDKVPPLWLDTLESGKMLAITVALLFPIALIGLNMGVLPYAETIGGKFVIALGLIAPVAVSPIFMAFLGLDERMKISIALFATGPMVIRGTYLSAKAIPKDLIFLAQTRRATEFEICYSFVAPIIFPDVLNTIRQSLVTAVSMLLFAEGLVSKFQVGFMYRMAVAMRNTSMDLILAYALWIVLGTFLLDLAFRIWIRCIPYSKAS